MSNPTKIKKKKHGNMKKNLDNKKIDENINFVNRHSRNGDLEVKIEDYEENL